MFLACLAVRQGQMVLPKHALSTWVCHLFQKNIGYLYYSLPALSSGFSCEGGNLPGKRQNLSGARQADRCEFGSLPGFLPEETVQNVHRHGMFSNFPLPISDFTGSIS
jgi:hypothetical protein